MALGQNHVVEAFLLVVDFFVVVFLAVVFLVPVVVLAAVFLAVPLVLVAFLVSSVAAVLALHDRQGCCTEQSVRSLAFFTNLLSNV